MSFASAILLVCPLSAYLAFTFLYSVLSALFSSTWRASISGNNDVSPRNSGMASVASSGGGSMVFSDNTMSWSDQSFSQSDPSTCHIASWLLCTHCTSVQVYVPTHHWLFFLHKPHLIVCVPGLDSSCMGGLSTILMLSSLSHDITWQEHWVHKLVSLDNSMVI